MRWLKYDEKAKKWPFIIFFMSVPVQKRTGNTGSEAGTFFLACSKKFV